MKITTIGDNLVQLTRLGAFNCYLVREADGFTLVDTGLVGSADGILAAAQQLGRPIRRIALTHAHGDHVGSLDVLANKLPDVELVFGGRTAVFLAGNLTLHPDEPQAKLRGSFVASSTQATRLVADGDRVGSLRVVAAPGHTPDHMAFFDGRDGTLIAGDAFQTKGGIAVAGQIRWLFPFPAMATWHKETAVSTAKKLLALNPTRLAVGHGSVLENPGAAMAAAIEAAR
ncbi:MAG: MBL fold metallo-hydrolase [Anaerolineales bacterium]|nr:MBL fold metallo-hydrolase [Anaerolineales bacterium]